MNFYTSINNNYLPKARILAKSIKKYCPNSFFSLVLADEIPANFDLKNEPFDELLLISDLGIPVENLDMWIYMHTVVELCTAIKGQALVYLLKSGAEKVVYLDPDIAVFNNLNEIEQKLDSYDVLLTPHQTHQESNKMDIENNEICSLKHGIYNFGFYAVRNNENGLNFAEWWRDRLIDYCFDDIPNGLFTDQRWGDLVPALFNNVFILKDPGCNVSTWNLTTREVKKNEQGLYTVNNELLKFYHFSGFDSGAQKVMLNINGKNNKFLLELREWYIRCLEEEEQELYGSYKSLYNYYNDHTVINKNERKLLRKRADVFNYFKNENPYLVGQQKSYKLWYKNEIFDKGLDEAADNEKIYELENQLNSIYKSKSWKIISFFTKNYDKLMGR